MGRVHDETLSQNKGCHEWEVLNLGQINTIKAMIKFRSKLDEFYNVKQQDSNSLDANDTPTFHEIIIDCYMDLEQLINDTPLKPEYYKIIEMLMQGYTEKDIAFFMKKDETVIIKQFYSICKKLKEQNDKKWEDWTETSGLVKTRNNYKICTRCKNPKKTVDFGADVRKKDGLKSYCRSCDKRTKL